MLIPGFTTLETLHESANAFVLRGARASDGHRVIIKHLAEEYPTAARLAAFRQEFEITRRLRPHAEICRFERIDGRWVMLTDDAGGTSLDRLGLAGELPLADFLAIAAKIAAAVARLHQAGVVHRDINPANIVLNAETGAVEVIDFSASTLLPRQSAGFTGTSTIQGTLAYIAPEQTGRVNRVIDHRADLYALGVTLYQLLVGQLPFTSEDPVELVYAHIAVLPRPPHELRPGLPPAVSRIILHLLAKNAEERYQTAEGLLHDLERCRELTRAGAPIELPRLGEADQSRRFHIPETLYGRERELGELLGAFDRVSAGACEVAMISGYPGIGKSALVRELYRPITQRHGFFIAGKFDQFNRNIPYASLFQAFRALVRLLLADPPERVAEWKRRILAAIGVNGEVLVRVIPEIALIIGPQPEVPELRPEDAQNRFKLTFQGFIQVFTKQQHPLVLFLDDLQWADHATLELLEVLVASPTAGHMLLIGAHRSNEVDASHLLLSAFDRLRRRGIRFTELVLAPLRPGDLAALLRDALDRDDDDARALAELVRDKTDGNPFFIGEFLRRLYDDELIALDPRSGRWGWDLGRIRGLNITDNVAELMSERLGALDEDARGVLTVAAVLGAHFELRALLHTATIPVAAATRALWRSLEAGLVATEGQALALLNLDLDDAAAAPDCHLRFAHDRVQQAAYDLTPAAELPALHLRVGRHLLAETPPEALSAQVFEIVGHLNLGRHLITDQAERDQLARLDLRAAERAKDASAFASAYSYFKIGGELLGDDGWARAPELAYALNLGAAESACMVRDFEAMSAIVEAILRRTDDPLRRVRAQEVLIQAKTLQLELTRAVQMAVAALRELGVHMPASPSKFHVIAAVLRTKLALAFTDLSGLAALPEASDPRVRARAEVMANVISAAYRGAANSFLLIAMEMVRLTVRSGNTPASGFAYSCYGIILTGALGDAVAGTALVPVCEAMLDLPMTRPFKSKTLFALGAFVLQWSQHLEVCADRLYQGYKAGLEVGDLEFASHCGYLRSYFRIRAANDLSELAVDLERMVTALRPLGEGRADELCGLYLQAVRSLRGEAADPLDLVGPGFDVHASLAESYRLLDKRAIVEICNQRAAIAFIFGDLAAARASVDRIPEHLEDLPGFPPGCESRLLDALIILADAPRLRGPERHASLRRARADLKALRRWAAAAPHNYGHMPLLVEAELARVEGREGAARALYDAAIAGAVENRYIRDEALACEAAQRFYAGIGGEALATYFLQRAHRAYLRWGATGKAEALEAAHPQLVRPKSPGQSSRNLTVHATVALDSSLDLSSVLRASQAIASEIVLDRLLDTLIRVLMTAAGADRGLLCQEREGAWVRMVDGRITGEGMTIERDAPTAATQAPLAVLRYVARTRETVVVDHPGAAGPIGDDPYLRAGRVRSALCMPLVNQARLVGILYLESSVGDGVFHEARLAFLRTLAGQIAVALENSDLFANLERKVEQRTAELRAANDSLVASNLELDAFARTVAHDLKNPLGTIGGYARYLLDDLREIDADELADVLGRIEQTGNQTVRIVNELLLLASVRKGDVKLVPVDMSEVIDDALRRLDGVIREYGATIHRPERWPSGIGHAAWIEEIWANYISNALKYGGRPPVVHLGADVEGDTLRFWVRDNGAGISAAEQGKVFSEFTRLEGVRAEGHGLGLSIVKRIADRLDSQIGLTSTLGEGSVFYFTLPAAP
jgi:predicted ATPase/signal transduction histidine kinase